MKSWTCIEKCGACCRIDITDRKSLINVLTKDEIELIRSMTLKDGWCKYLDKSDMKCTIYEDRPYFCRVNKFSNKFKEYKKTGDKFLINCCKDHISSIYGKNSDEMKRFKMETLKN